MNIQSSTRIALLTGPSCAGKSTLVHKLALPSLEGDHALYAGFERLGHPQFRDYVVFRSQWAFLRPQIDAEFMRYHRDWYGAAGSPACAVAEAWIYAFQDWRNLFATALMDEGREIEFRLFVLDPPYEVYRERRNERLQALAMPKDESQTRALYDMFFRELQTNGIPTERGDDGAIISAISTWMGQT